MFGVFVVVGRARAVLLRRERRMGSVSCMIAERVLCQFLSELMFVCIRGIDLGICWLLFCEIVSLRNLWRTLKVSGQWKQGEWVFVTCAWRSFIVLRIEASVASLLWNKAKIVRNWRTAHGRFEM